MCEAGQAVLRVSEVGEYIRHQSCDRRLKLNINNRALARRLPFAERLFNTLDPVLREEGRRREAEWEASLRRRGLTDLTRYGAAPEDDDDPPTWQAFCEAAAALTDGEAAFGREVAIQAPVGEFSLRGRIDFLLLLWVDGSPVLRVVECKASRRDRTYQRIQVAIYSLMLRHLLSQHPLTIQGQVVRQEDLQAVVARIDEATNRGDEILSLPPLDLDMEMADVLRLLAPDGRIQGVLGADLESISFQIEQKCDGCVFNTDCLPECARGRRLELIGASASACRALRMAGVRDLDALAALDLTSIEAQRIQADPSFGEHLGRLSALARARTVTLPGGAVDPDAYEVAGLPQAPPSQLPDHIQQGERLLRVYLAVDYDYVENRVGALSAHITNSDARLNTSFFMDDDGRWRPDPEVHELIDMDGDQVRRPVEGREVIVYKDSEWTGDYAQDTGAERELIQQFVSQLIDAIADVAGEGEVPIHFYCWSRSEMTQLVEGCSRASSRLLSSLRELLGCRESLEQLIYSCLQDEVDRRFALGWTGRGLSVVSSLRWFGRRYHWTRRVSGSDLALDGVFTQDIFDFKTTLDLGPDGNWARPGRGVAQHRFEIRSRFHDSLTAPYWRALWGTLPDPGTPGLPHDVSNSIRRYNEAARPNRFREYLRARVHCLRWVEEGIRFKNAEITKSPVSVAELRRFRLGVDDPARAGIDFLRLDHFVRAADWLAGQILSPAYRVPRGTTLPLSEVVSSGPGQLTAFIDLEPYDLDLRAMESRCPYGPQSWVRVSPCSDDPYRAQTIGQLLRGGKTCIVQDIDWDTGQIALNEIFMRDTRYVLSSVTSRETGQVFDYATLDESPSDFVAGIVETALEASADNPIFSWFDPEGPEIPPVVPLEEDRLAELGHFLEGFVLPDNGRLGADQRQAILEGLGTRVQLLQGPPGTGKTLTTAISALVRMVAGLSAGDVVIVAAHTHTAVDTFLRAVAHLLPVFADQCTAAGLRPLSVRLAKVFASQLGDGIGPSIERVVATSSARSVNQLRAGSVLIAGGTTNAMLKLGRELSTRVPWRSSPDGFRVPLLIVDEASMMVLPHFLALATMVEGDGRVLLAGDHRQLSPIVAHDWEREDRPPMILYQPFASAYDAIRSVACTPGMELASITRSSLDFTFRLPPLVLDLIARLYRLDAIELRGLVRPEAHRIGRGRPPAWESVWQGETGLFLVLHTEDASRQSNSIEVEIIRHILEAYPAPVDNSVAILTPHRAQRALLRGRLQEFEPVADVIDTVDRLQGGERRIVIVSGTASDPSAIANNAEFLLDLNRSNVAFSRTRDRLIVVCAHSLLDHVPAELENYQAAMLWKALRSICTLTVAEQDLQGFSIQVRTVPLDEGGE